MGGAAVKAGGGSEAMSGMTDRVRLPRQRTAAVAEGPRWTGGGTEVWDRGWLGAHGWGLEGVAWGAACSLAWAVGRGRYGVGRLGAVRGW